MKLILLIDKYQKYFSSIVCLEIQTYLQDERNKNYHTMYKDKRIDRKSQGSTLNIYQQILFVTQGYNVDPT